MKFRGSLNPKSTKTGASAVCKSRQVAKFSSTPARHFAYVSTRIAETVSVWPSLFLPLEFLRGLPTHYGGSRNSRASLGSGGCVLHPLRERVFVFCARSKGWMLFPSRAISGSQD